MYPAEAPSGNRSDFSAKACSVVRFCAVYTVPLRMYPTPIAVVAGCSVDEIRNAAELQAEGVSGGVVNQNEELQSGAISLQRDPACHRIELALLIDLHVVRRYRWSLRAVVRLHRHYHVHGHVGGGVCLLSRGRCWCEDYAEK